jgi:hypothetical protein
MGGFTGFSAGAGVAAEEAEFAGSRATVALVDAAGLSVLVSGSPDSLQV